jgi:antitoxin MazE
MDVVLKKWGNSAAVRIPAAVFEAAKLALDQTVDVRVENGRVVLEPVAKQDYDLSTLIAGITPENTHASVDFGKPVGRELW